MSIRGPDALAALEDALRDIRREEDDILRKLGRGLERMAKIRDGEGELLRQFAEGRLPPDQEAELGDEVTRSGIALREALKRAATEAAATAEHLRRLEARFIERNTARAAALADIDHQQSALRALSPRIATAITRAPAYAQQRQIVASLKTITGAALLKCRQADIDREQKGRPFREDPLFSYLMARSYGTPAYAGRGIGARLDAHLARFIGFEAARANYALLNALPSRLRAHAEQQKQRASAAEDALDEFERGAIDAAGGAEIRAGLTAAQQRIAAIDEELLALQDERDRALTTEAQLTESDDMTFERALGALVRALGSPDLQSLIGAQRVANPGAELPLVTQLDDARLRIVEERTDGRDQRARLATLAARRRGLEDIAFELKARRFDDPRSLFRDDDLIGGRLDNFLIGAIGADTYWTLWRSGQAWTAGTSDWGGGVGLPRHGREPADPGAPPPQQNFSRPRAAARTSA